MTEETSTAKLDIPRLEVYNADLTSKTSFASESSKNQYQKSLATTQETQESNALSDEELIASIPNKEAEAKIITQAIDLHLMPLFCVFYFMDYIDRANLGNAALGGIQKHLGLTPAQFSNIISAFYIFYIIFEIPSNIILKRVDAAKWLSFMLLMWGSVTVGMGFAKNFESLFACRILLGLAQSGYLPGTLYMMSHLYRPHELGLRVALLLSMSYLSGIVSGPIAYATAFLEGQKGLHGWQYLFIFEGTFTVCLSIVSYFYLFENIDGVRWLTPAQKALHREYTNALHKDQQDKVTFKTMIEAVLDWKTYSFSIIIFLYLTTATSSLVFLPTIIDGFGFPVLTSQLLTAPPNLVAFFLVIVGGLITDRYENKRGMLVCVGFAIAGLGYVLLLTVQGRWARYACLFAIPIGMSLQSSGNMGWSVLNYAKPEVRAVAIALIVSIGNTGSIVGSYLYPLNQAPNYYFGHTFSLCVTLSGAVITALTTYLLYRHNKKALMFEDTECTNEKMTYKYHY